MTTESPEQVLTEVRRLRRRSKARAHGGVWLPVAVLAGLLLLSIALYTSPFRAPHEMTVAVPFWAGLPSEQRDPTLSYAFWFVGTPAAFALIAAWYRWRVRRVGVRVGWHWALAAGLVALVALAVLAAVPVELPRDVPLGTLTADQPSLGSVLLDGVRTPLLPLAVATVVLGVAEGSRALVAAGGWVALVAYVQCTIGVAGVFAVLDGSRPSSFARYDTLPGPLVLAMAAPLVLFAATRAVRAPFRSGAR